jgi:hypothetical protein
MTTNSIRPFAAFIIAVAVLFASMAAVGAQSPSDGLEAPKGVTAALEASEPSKSTTAAPTASITTTSTTSTTSTTTAPAPTTTSPPAPDPEPVIEVTTIGSGDPRDPSSWDRLAQCESGGDWSIDTGNGYYGGLQFSLSSWQGVGGTGLPSDASRETQIALGQRLHASGGWGHWPGCTQSFGWT